MKEAIITDINGLYIEPTLVADSVTGVFPIEESMESETSNQSVIPESKITGYTVAIPLPDGLYDPTFDLISYDQARKHYEKAYADYQKQLSVYDPESGELVPQPPLSVDWSQFWRNGLTDEEIEALKPIPQPDPTETLGGQMVQRELEALEFREQNVILGTKIVEKELQILELKGKDETLDRTVADLERRLLELEAKANV
ncbi:hypothetical protein [Paenibacillus sp. 1001270B_150601_E10]|uniref:hypothetical protein n=1 Tax=Paenibacillus sp. 1001270B_150601_E10 TaxID=2787079 RepID=UPI0018A06DC2|nr:hypothetical protein [Paenibacillus sp. 1001270B_150601_E10]